MYYLIVSDFDIVSIIEECQSNILISCDAQWFREEVEKSSRAKMNNTNKKKTKRFRSW
jgi:hypothetical protein